MLTEIDVRQTLKDKLDIDVDPQIILGAGQRCGDGEPARRGEQSHEVAGHCVPS